MNEILEALRRIEEKLDQLEEDRRAERELRALGHRVIWSKDGSCNVPGMMPLPPDKLREQLARQKRYGYG